MDENITIITGNGCWLESAAADQLRKTAELPGFVRAVGLPDLHPGRVPVGAVIETRGRIYPHLVGNDIGCGMTLFGTGISVKQFKAAKWVKRLEKLKLSAEIAAGGPIAEPLPSAAEPEDAPGTLGGGNHFAEFMVVERPWKTAGWPPWPGDGPACGEGEILLLIHCGSRNLGQRIYSAFADPAGLAEGTEKFQRYLEAHDGALRFAEKNRRVVAERLLDQLGFRQEVHPLIDCLHNFVEERNALFLHRKGAAAAQPGKPVVIPGSRGSYTYVVVPTEEVEESLWSLAHGAGRRCSRSDCQGRFREKYRAEELRTTKMKSFVVCSDKRLLYEEAPDAYKNIEAIISCMEDRGLIRTTAILRPLLTYKG